MHTPHDAKNGESHTSPMALAEILVKFLDQDIGELDYEEAWAANDPKFSAITTFSASRESTQWLRDYLSDSLKYARESAESKARHGRKWNGWFEEKDWVGWQEHMTNLVSRLDSLLASMGDSLDFLTSQEQSSETQPENNDFSIMERVCVSTPDRRHFLILQVQDNRTGETVWAIGDDQVCAMTRSDFIRNRGINYNDVLIQEFPYRDYTPESVGEWQSVIKELVEFTLQKYMEHDGLAHVYPQWLPEDVHPWMGKELYNQMVADADHLILYPNNIMDMVPRAQGPAMGQPTL